MKLLTYLQNGKEKWGFALRAPDGRELVCCPQDVEDHLVMIRTPGTCYDLAHITFMPDGKWPEDLAAFLALGEEGMDLLRKMAQFISIYAFSGDVYRSMRYIVPIEEVTVKAPIPRPRIYWGLVANCPTFCRLNAGKHFYNLLPRGHNRPQTTAVGLDETLVFPRSHFPFGFNVELGVIIGKKGKYIKACEAASYIAGYTNVLDMAPFDIYRAYDPEQPFDMFDAKSAENKRVFLDFFTDQTASWGGKKMDCRCPMGPYLVTRDEVPNPYDLMCFTRQDGKQRDRCWTGALMQGIERVIEYYSSFATLYPGDVLHLGTMGIDGLLLDYDMPAGKENVLEGEIERLGSLQMHYVVEGKEDWRDADDPSRNAYKSPVVRDLVVQGKDTTSRFDPGEMRSFYVCFGNYRRCTELEGMAVLADVPRFINNPVSAVSMDKTLTMAPRTTDVDISAELAFVVKKVAHKVPVEQADDYILGYTPMVACIDHSFTATVIQPANDEENGLTEWVYSRWGDGYNMVEVPAQVGWDAVQNRSVTLSLPGIGRMDANIADYIMDARQVLSFISQYITLTPNDVITLGRIGELLPVSQEQVECGIRGSIEIDGVGAYAFSVKK